MLAIVRRYPVASYFTLAIALSWIGIFLVIGTGPIPAPPSEAEQLFPLVYLAMLVGPSVAGIALTWATRGSQGLRDFRDRLFTWRVQGRWYVVALLTAPATLLLVETLLSVGSADFLPAIVTGGTDPAGPMRDAGRLSLILFGLGVGVGAGVFEELGWTGFATPMLRERCSVVRTALLIGIVWGAWHFLAIYWGSADVLASVPAPLYMVVALFAFLPPYRVLMTWVYEHTHSLLVGILMHVSLTTSMFILEPQLSGRAMLVYDVAFGCALWILAWAALAARKQRLASPAPRLA